jgi:hypothetical protein
VKVEIKWPFYQQFQSYTQLFIKNNNNNNNNNNKNSTHAAESANVEAQKSLILKTALYAPLTVLAE